MYTGDQCVHITWHSYDQIYTKYNTKYNKNIIVLYLHVYLYRQLYTYTCRYLRVYTIHVFNIDTCTTCNCTYTCIYRQTIEIHMYWEQVYIEKKVSLWLLCGVHHSVIMANFIMPETQQPIIVIISIIYSPYLLKTF